MPRVPLWRLRHLLHWRGRTLFHSPLLILCNSPDDLLTHSGSGDLGVAAALRPESRGRPCVRPCVRQRARQRARSLAAGARSSPQPLRSGAGSPGRAGPRLRVCRAGAGPLLWQPRAAPGAGPPSCPFPLHSHGPRAAPAMVRCGAVALRKVSAAGPGTVGTVPQAALGWRAGGERRFRSWGLCGSSRVPGGAGRSRAAPVPGARQGDDVPRWRHTRPPALRLARRGPAAPGPARREVSLPGKTRQALIKNYTCCFLKFRLLP